MDDQIQEVLLYDATSKLVQQKTVASTDCQLNTSAYPAGIYSIVVKTTKGQVMKMLLIE